MPAQSESEPQSRIVERETPQRRTATRQEISQTPTAPANAAQRVTTEKSDPARITLDFPGGTPSELIDAMSKALGRQISAVFPVGSERIEIPPFTVEEADETALLKSLYYREQFEIRDRNAISYREVGYNWGWIGGVWRLEIDRVSGVGPVNEVVPVGVGELLRHYTIEEITTAIRLGWDNLPAPAYENSPYYLVRPNKAPASLHYHEETQLLVAVASEPELQLMRQTLSTLQDQPAPYIEVTVLGAIREPGTYRLPSNDATLRKLSAIVSFSESLHHPSGVFAKVDLKNVQLTRSQRMSATVDMPAVLNGPTELKFEQGDILTVSFSSDADGNPVPSPSTPRRRVVPRTP
ncbi:MAG: hypothetical protein ACFBZ8_11115 [Opitutales bacterium]